jgi:hypothetical protein
LKYYCHGINNSHLLLKYAAHTNRFWLFSHLLTTHYYNPKSVDFSHIFDIPYNELSPDIIIFLIQFGQKNNLNTYPHDKLYEYIFYLIKETKIDMATRIIELTKLNIIFEIQLNLDYALHSRIYSMANNNRIDMMKFFITYMGLTKRNVEKNFYKFLEVAGRKNHLDFIKYVVQSLDINPSKYSERIWAIELLKQANRLSLPVVKYIINDYLSLDKCNNFGIAEHMLINNTKQYLESQNE